MYDKQDSEVTVTATSLIDLTGQRFGKLTVLCKDGRTKHGDEANWLCRCDCGAIKSIKSSALRRGDAKSCGCDMSHKKSCKRGIDLVGEKFGHLTVVEKAKSGRAKNGRTFSNWVCICDCGNQKIVRQRDLTENRIKSCGCSSNKMRAQAVQDNYPIRYKTLQGQPTTSDILAFVTGETIEPNAENIEVVLKELFAFFWANKVRNEQTKLSRQNQRSKAITICELCGKDCNPQIHHVIPVSSFGGNEDTNIMWLCLECHHKMHRSESEKEGKNIAKN